MMFGSTVSLSAQSRFPCELWSSIKNLGSSIKLSLVLYMIYLISQNVVTIGDTLLQNNHHIVGWPKLYSLGCSTVAKISELLGSPSSWLDSNFKFSQIYEHYFFDWLCVFPTNKTFIVFDYFISAWPLLWLAPQCTILYCLAHYRCIEICQYYFFKWCKAKLWLFD